MHPDFESIKPQLIEKNLISLIGEEWMLVCAGKPGNYNMMTASWGAAGYLWNKPIAIIFIRPQRHTFSFAESNDRFTLNFFGQQQRELLNLCGTRSGRELDKMNLDGLTALETNNGNVCFAQAQLVLECRKVYHDDIKPDSFEDFDFQKIYPSADYHRFYIGVIEGCWVRKS